jgi:flagellar hook-basal body complex protein FliE
MVIEGLIGAVSSAVLGSVGTAATAATSASGSAGVSATPFSGVFQSMVQQTTALEAKASQAVTGLLSGQGVEVHDAMMATQKADMAFELAMQVRNKAVAAYQQMMGMQF